MACWLPASRSPDKWQGEVDFIDHLSRAVDFLTKIAKRSNPHIIRNAINRPQARHAANGIPFETGSRFTACAIA